MIKKFPLDFRPGMQGLSKVLGNLESEIMDIIWHKSCEVTVRDIYAEIAARREIAYTTVMTIMGRLAEKKLLNKRKTGNTSYFLPSLSRGEFTENVVGKVVDSLFEDFAEATVAHFVKRVHGEDRETIDKLEKLLADRRKDDQT